MNVDDFIGFFERELFGTKVELEHDGKYVIYYLDNYGKINGYLRVYDCDKLLYIIKFNNGRMI